MLDGYNWVVNNATEEGKIGSSLVSMSLGKFLSSTPQFFSTFQKKKKKEEKN